MTVLDDVRSRGFFVVIIHPSTYDAERVKQVELQSILTRTSVHLRGWDLPHIDPKAPILHGQRHVSQESEWGRYREVWRFHQSGQMAIVRAFAEDWRDGSEDNSDTHLNGRRELGVIETLYALTEVFELAARLAFSPAGAETMRIDISFRNLEGRTLVVDDPRRAPFLSPYVYHDTRYDRVWDLDRAVLGAEAWDIALAGAIEMFATFGWTTNSAVMRDAQSQLRGPARRRA